MFQDGGGPGGLHTQWYNKASDVATSSLMKVITGVQRTGDGILKTGVNGYNVPFVNKGFTKYVFTFKSNF